MINEIESRQVKSKSDFWLGGMQYERFMGRWSDLIAKKFLDWLGIPPSGILVDMGCGTGSLTRLMLEKCRPKAVISIDSSRDFIFYARQSIKNPAVHFQAGSAEALELKSNSVDAVFSGLMLNFVSKPEAAISEMIRVSKPGGKIGIFLWDYAGKMQMLRYFWDAAIELDNKATESDEGIRFPLCKEGQLESFVWGAGLKNVETKALEVKTFFQDFDDYWQPFFGNVGPAPRYIANLNEKDRHKLEKKLRQTLPIREDGSISLMARAWAVKGTV